MNIGLSERQVAGVGEHAQLRKQTILIIDDNADLLSLGQIALELKGYDVLTALSGNEAFSILSGLKNLELILLDLQMPGMSGTEFLEQLERRRPDIFAAVPVVFLTGMDFVPESKASGFIERPIDMELFLSAVRGYVEAGRPRRLGAAVPLSGPASPHVAMSPT